MPTGTCRPSRHEPSGTAGPGCAEGLLVVVGERHGAAERLGVLERQDRPVAGTAEAHVVRGLRAVLAARDLHVARDQHVVRRERLAALDLPDGDRDLGGRGARSPASWPTRSSCSGRRRALRRVERGAVAASAAVSAAVIVIVLRRWSVRTGPPAGQGRFCTADPTRPGRRIGATTTRAVRRRRSTCRSSPGHRTQ